MYETYRALSTCLVLMGAVLSHEADAAILTVTSLADAGPGTLRDQVAAAAPGDTIDFSVTGTITMTGSSDIPIAKNLTITGPGAGSLIVSRTLYSTAIFRIGSGVVGISGITFSSGNGTDTIGAGGAHVSYGGAIHVTGGTVTIADSAFSDNSATNGGALHVGGGMVSVTGCTFSNNSGSNGGAIGVGAGGALTVGGSTISGNTSSHGGGVDNFGTATIVDSTISGNTTPNNGASTGLGAGLCNNGTMTVRNCTLSGNRSLASNGTAIPGGGGICNESGVLTVANSTITGNQADGGGGIKNFMGMTLNLSNTIVAGNSTRSGIGPDIQGAVASGDYNLVKGTADTTLSGTHNVIGLDALTGALQNNGGPTQTCALLAGSPAIDAGDPDFDAATTPNDQRGPGFPRVKNGRVCIGAYESGLEQGSNLVVNTLDDHDDGTAGGASDCTLREAVKYATPGGSITFSVAGTITLTLGEMVVAKSLSISGPAAATGITVSGNNASRIFSINQSPAGGSSTVSLTRLSLTAGNAIGTTSSSVGGALCCQNFGSALTGTLTMTVTNCSFTGNSANIGGALRSLGSMTVIGSTFSGNSAISGGGAIQNGGTLTLTNSTFSGNTATGTGTNGIGGALRTFGNLTVTHSTFSGNSAITRSGAIEVGGGTTNLSNTIVAGNSAPIGPEIGGTVAAGDYNLVQNPADATLAGTHNITGQAAKLGPLSDNGGPTRTHALLAGSPALNAGSNALIPGGVTTDQRGSSRVVSGTVDIGALEVDPTPLTATINQAAAQTDPTISAPIQFTVVFNKPVTGFTNTDVTLAGTAWAASATVTGSGNTYQVAVTGMTRSGTVIATIAAGAALDAANNVNAASTGTDNTISYSSPETVLSSGTIHAIEGGGGGFVIGFIGNPGQPYTIQFSSDMAPSNWQTLATEVADPAGLISTIDHPPAGTPRRFYRQILP